MISYLDIMKMMQFVHQKYCLMAMANVIQKEPYLWLFYELVRFHVEFMVSQLIKDFKKEQ